MTHVPPAIIAAVIPAARPTESRVRLSSLWAAEFHLQPVADRVDMRPPCSRAPKQNLRKTGYRPGSRRPSPPHGLTGLDVLLLGRPSSGLPRVPYVTVVLYASSGSRAVLHERNAR